MFRRLGSIIPDAVFADIGLFFDKDQLHQFCLTSSTANGLFNSHRMMAYKKIEILALKNNKISIELQDSNSDDTKRKIYIDTDKEDITEKMSILLSTCHSIDMFHRFSQLFTNCNDFIFNEKIIELMLNIKIKNMLLVDCSIMAPLPIFMKFLYRHGNILTLCGVKLPSELVSNKTLKLIHCAGIRPRPDSDLVVDVTNELLEGANTRFTINFFMTKFTVKGISAFVKKDGHSRRNEFGIIASNQLQDAINFERDHRHRHNGIYLTSMNGQKSLVFYVMLEIGKNLNSAGFSINLNMTETDPFGMIPIPHYLFGIVAQEAFVKFDKICNNPAERLPISQYHMQTMQINYTSNLSICYNIRGENRTIDSNSKSGITRKDAQKIIAAILGNCTSIEELVLEGIELDEDFYNLLKTIAHNIDVTTEWSIESALEPEYLREVQAANTGLFGKVIVLFPTRN